jgi:type I restriction enzyme R subunit
MRPEDRSREQIDRLLDRAGWRVQDLAKAKLSAGLGVAIREFPLRKGHGFAD